MLKTAFLAVTAVLFVFGLIVAPTIRADDPPPIAAKDITTSRENLKKIVLAFHKFDVDGMLPSNILDADDKPLLSWRVALLPYLDQQKLYEEFKLDEPWDSEHNKKLIGKMPKIYAPVRVKAKAGETFYQTMTGERTLYVKHRPVYRISTIPDGTSNTGLVFEAGEPVIWTKPADMVFDEKKDVPKLGGMFDGECLVGMGDGYVLHIKKEPDQQHLKYLIMPNDGIPINLEILRK